MLSLLLFNKMGSVYLQGTRKINCKEYSFSVAFDFALSYLFLFEKVLNEGFCPFQLFLVTPQHS